MTPGRFISFEGGEGAGKSTQVKAVAERLRRRGLPVVETREPGGSAGAEAIRALLLGGEVDRWSAETEALLFAAARADHVARVIRPALDHGTWVLCDRYVDSSYAYQGGAGGVGISVVARLHQIGSNGLLPDRTVLLDLPEYTAGWRAAARDDGVLDRFGQKPGNYHNDVASAFKALAQADQARFRIVDAQGEVAEVTDRILSALEDLF